MYAKLCKIVDNSKIPESIPETGRRSETGSRLNKLKNRYFGLYFHKNLDVPRKRMSTGQTLTKSKYLTYKRQSHKIKMQHQFQITLIAKRNTSV